MTTTNSPKPTALKRKQRATAREQVKNRNSYTFKTPRPKRTHCKRGHEFTPENTIAYGNGTRTCRECRNAGARAKRKASAS